MSYVPSEPQPQPEGSGFEIVVDESRPKPKSPSVPISLYRKCGRPILFFLLVRGGLGEILLGALASGVCYSIHKSDLRPSIQVMLNLLTGAAAILIWIVVISLFPGYLESKFKS